MTLRAVLIAVLVFIVGGAGGYYGCVRFPPPARLAGETLVEVNKEPAFVIFNESNGETFGAPWEVCQQTPKCKAADLRLAIEHKRDILHITVDPAEGSSNKHYPHDSAEDNWEIAQ